MMFQDFTIVIQGPIHRNLITMATLHPFINTVISIWEDSRWTHPTLEEYLEPIRRENLQLSINPLPDTTNVYNKQNRYYQFQSTYNGLKLVNTKYAIKIRSDEYYTDLLPLISLLLQSDEKLVTNDVYFRKVSYLRYHVSDHIMAAKTENMLKLFEELLYDCKYNADKLKMDPFKETSLICFAEQQIGMKYIELFERQNVAYNHPSDHDEVRALMMKYFDVISSSLLGDFYVTANSERKVYINNCSYLDERKDITSSLDEL